MPKPTYRFAIDGNEANVKNRVGSNVYAFEVIRQLYEQTADVKKFHCTLLLSRPPVDDLPAERPNWQYRVVTPAKLWTQWALPLHLFWHRNEYDLLYTPGHYAPRLSSVPYVSSVMDLAFLEFPEQFRKNDLYQLKHWTRYSVQRARKVITISQFSKKNISERYATPPKNIVVAPPAVALPKTYSPLRAKAFLRKQGIEEGNYLLYLGTLQPRKNLPALIEGFEIFSRSFAADHLKKRTSHADEPSAPQLVIAGKVGWLAEETLARIAASPIKHQIITTGFISDDLKRPLYEKARAVALVGLSEGFGIPPLEALSVGTMPIVSNTSSLPEVVGSAGLTVSPTKPQEIADALKYAWSMNAREKAQFQKRAAKQARKFSWKKTGTIVLQTLISVARQTKG